MRCDETRLLYKNVVVVVGVFFIDLQTYTPAEWKSFLFNKKKRKFVASFRSKFEYRNMETVRFTTEIC